MAPNSVFPYSLLTAGETSLQAIELRATNMEPCGRHRNLASATKNSNDDNNSSINDKINNSNSITIVIAIIAITIRIIVIIILVMKISKVRAWGFPACMAKVSSADEGLGLYWVAFTEFHTSYYICVNHSNYSIYIYTYIHPLW